MDTILEMRNLTKKFGGLTAVNDLTMEVPRGKISALIGPNGSGKTTTINLISNAFKVDSGTITFHGDKGSLVISDMKEYETARAGIRRTYQNIRLYGRMSALDNVRIGCEGNDQNVLFTIFNWKALDAQEKETSRQALEMLKFVGLEHIENRMVGDFPYGIQKKLEIARALISQPKMVLLDEPATGLNPRERVELVELIYKIRDTGKTILIIEHNMDVVMGISDVVNVLNFGTLIARGTPKEIQSNADVIVAYLGLEYTKSGGYQL
jgi:branched-chain amino acid transport system ATP-binding protein